MGPLLSLVLKSWLDRRWEHIVPSYFLSGAYLVVSLCGTMGLFHLFISIPILFLILCITTVFFFMDITWISRVCGLDWKA